MLLQVQSCDRSRQIDNVDLDVLGLFTSRTDKACLGDLLNFKYFIREAEAEELVEEFLSSTP